MLKPVFRLRDVSVGIVYSRLSIRIVLTDLESRRSDAVVCLQISMLESNTNYHATSKSVVPLIEYRTRSKRYRSENDEYIGLYIIIM